ncbi:F0F1 ATP synthase subunit B family protein [Novosphingobium lentum]|uniref:F0F1 ATP synthase subunit B family protein n=1 Tax=Novosphingobium lentum TaxID=145287 RepID=UPI003F6F4734
MLILAAGANAANATEMTKLDQADKTTALAGQEHVHEVEPVALGLNPGAWVALSMAVFIAILIWKKVPAVVTSGLDKQIDAIRRQLDEAKTLRAEAEKLRAEYAAKIANAEKDAAAMLDHARHEADAIVAKAEVDATAMVGRREKMAQDKIGAAERAAVDGLRARAADAAADAARTLIAANHGAVADKALVDGAIADLAKH